MRKGICLLALVFAVGTVGTSGCCSIGWSFQVGQPSVVTHQSEVLISPNTTTQSMQAVGGYAGPVASGTWMTGTGHTAAISPYAAPPVALAAPPCSPAPIPARAPDVMTCEEWCRRFRQVPPSAAPQPMPQAPPAAHPDNRQE